MKIYVIVASGDYTDTINGETVTAGKTELLRAFTDHEEARKALMGLGLGPELPNAEKWGITAISIYTVDLEGCDLTTEKVNKDDGILAL